MEVSDDLSETKPETIVSDISCEEAGTFKVIFNKQKFDINFNLNSTISQLKEHLQTVIGNTQQYLFELSAE